MGEETTVNHPSVLWAQRFDRVFVSIQLEDVKDEKIAVDANKLQFSAKCHDKFYSVELEFYGELNPEESKQRKGGREYFFDLKKKESGPFWPRLLKTKNKQKYIKVDFNRWKDEDDSEDEEPGYGDANLDQMLQQMGGMNNAMPDMSDLNLGGGDADIDADGEDDSDDEEMPDLEG